jgi:hypothetical protein
MAQLPRASMARLQRRCAVTRLTDEQLSGLMGYAFARADLSLGDGIMLAVNEIRERRAADLTDEEREGLALILRVMIGMSKQCSSDTLSKGIAALCRLLGSDK